MLTSFLFSWQVLQIVLYTASCLLLLVAFGLMRLRREDFFRHSDIHYFN